MMRTAVYAGTFDPITCGHISVIERSSHSPAHAHLSEVSSSKLKELVHAGLDVSKYCPGPIAERLKERLASSITTPETCHG